MLLLKPAVAMLDEIDSGLDVDALRIVADAILHEQKENKTGILVVSHYARFLGYLQPTHAHVLVDGRVVVSGGPELIQKIDDEGYDWIEKTYHVHARKEEKEKPVLLESCGAKKTE
jgi:Fe-S cluster assembly ATP-binding protein